MEFKSPWIFILLPILLFLVYFFQKKGKEPSFRFSSASLWKGIESGWKVWLGTHVVFLRMICVFFFVCALAGPRLVLEERRYKAEGIDIVLAIDVSGSMAAEDFKIDGKRHNRLYVVKKVVRDFIEERKNDRIGMVTFARFAYTVCPLTFDQDWLIHNLERIRFGLMEDGTAVGSAIASSVARQEDSKAKSKVIILLTDGVNNAGKIDPVSAAEMAKAFNIRIYTIGAGTKGPVPFPVKDFWGRTVYQDVEINLDDQTLKKVAKITGGKFFRAMDTESLKLIYQEINRLEKTEIQQTGYREYRQFFWIFLSLALFALLLEIILTNTIILKVP